MQKRRFIVSECLAAVKNRRKLDKRSLIKLDSKKGGINNERSVFHRLVGGEAHQGCVHVCIRHTLSLARFDGVLYGDGKMLPPKTGTAREARGVKRATAEWEQAHAAATSSTPP